MLLEHLHHRHVVPSHRVLERVGSPSVFGVDVGVLGEEELHGAEVPLRCCQVQRRSAVVHEAVDARVALDQLRHRVHVALRARLAQLLRQRLLVLGVDPRAFLNQKVAHLAVSVEHRFLERITPPAIPDVDVCLTLDQKLHHRQVPLGRRKVHCTALVVVGGVGVRASVHQLAQELHISFGSCFTKVFPQLLLRERLLVLGVDPRAFLNQKVAHLAVSVEHRFLERITPPAIPDVDVCLTLDQKLHHRQVPLGRRKVHCTALVVVGGVGVRACIHQPAQELQISFICCFTEVFAELLLLFPWSSQDGWISRTKSQHFVRACSPDLDTRHFGQCTGDSLRSAD
mmetsp:Transcript_23533/g.56133  ORF Transcript_23533/g.56133 Transcript_23533/m.56133 type:complete len:342 (-) Transcript_23533:240-1265(-)